MSEQRHAPGWRGRASRTGPITGPHDTPIWILNFERLAPLGCAIVLAIVAACAAYAWGVDALAGHL